MTMLWILLFVPVYFVWTAVHELSHFFMAKWLVNASLVKIRLWPHFRDDSEGDGLWRRLRWGSIRWETKLAISHEAFAIISFAPRVPNAVAVIALPFAYLFEPPGLYVWTIVWAAGIVDLCYGSIGYSPHSDLRKGARELRMSPWIFRCVGWSLAVASCSVWAILVFG